MKSEVTINIDEFVKSLLSSVESLPTNNLELCDLANEIGMVIARLSVRILVVKERCYLELIMDSNWYVGRILNLLDEKSFKQNI